MQLDATNFKPALIDSINLTIVPTIFKIGQFSIWIMSITDFPLPLEQGCWIRITIPKDLRYDNSNLNGWEIFQPADGGG